MDEYFVCHKFRSHIDHRYVREFYEKKSYSKLHDNYEDAYKEMRQSFFDDSDYAVYKVRDNQTFERIK